VIDVEVFFKELPRFFIFGKMLKLIEKTEQKLVNLLIAFLEKEAYTERV